MNPNHFIELAVVFIPIDEPPKDPSEEEAKEFVRELEILSRDLCPVIMFHGQGSVISTDI